VPLYEYRCTNCGHKFEKIQKFSDEPERVCPKCQGDLVRPMTAPALKFEGAGWYINDYSSKGKPAANSGGEAKTESKTETKTAEGGAAASGSTSASAPATTPSASAPSSSAPGSSTTAS